MLTLRGLIEALNPDQRVIMSPEQEYFFLDIGIPNKGFMIQSRTD